jgi:hypothetical protein
MKHHAHIFSAQQVKPKAFRPVQQPPKSHVSLRIV